MGLLFVISTSLCAFTYVIPAVINYIVAWLFSESEQEKYLKKQLAMLEQDMSIISMVDEFAKYTKIQRRHTKIREDFKKRYSERISSKAKKQLLSTYAARIFNGLVMLIIMNLYRSEPVISLPKGILWPLDSFLSWPSDYQDCISLAMWIVISTVVISSKNL